MLILARKVGETVVIDGKVHVTVVRVGRGVVRLSVEAPRDIRVDREEVRRCRKVGGRQHPPVTFAVR